MYDVSDYLFAPTLVEEINVPCLKSSLPPYPFIIMYNGKKVQIP